MTHTLSLSLGAQDKALSLAQHECIHGYQCLSALDRSWPWRIGKDYGNKRLEMSLRCFFGANVSTPQWKQESSLSAVCESLISCQLWVMMVGNGNRVFAMKVFDAYT